jgi:small subunit ribosomal protein S2
MTNNSNEATILEMAKIGVIYGHKKSKTHPRMKQYIAGNRNEIEILNPEATLAGLATAIEFIKGKLSKGGIMLLVGPAASARFAIETFAKEYKMPYVISRWMGGTLTNFKVLRDRYVYYDNLKQKHSKGELSKYTKKEQLEFGKEVGKMSELFENISGLTRVPDVLFVVDTKKHEIAVREAKIAGVPVVGILDTDDNVDIIDYPILANDRAKSSIDWVMGQIKTGLKGMMVEVPQPPQEKTASK